MVFADKADMFAPYDEEPGLLWRYSLFHFTNRRKDFDPIHGNILCGASFFYLTHPLIATNMKKLYVCLFLSIAVVESYGQVGASLQAKLDQQATEIEPKLVEWRRDFHQHPELSNREFNTGKKIAEYLKSLGIEVQYPVAKTGVVGLLKGSKPGPVVALRADMDALPVNERNSLPFLSKEKATFNGMETGVMHACGHDTHMAILMGVAQILARNKMN